MLIRVLDVSDLSKAIYLISQTFNEFVAPYYSDEGIDTFYNFANIAYMSKMMQVGSLKCWGAFEGDKLLGVIAVKGSNHISLFFVAGAYHRKGIGKKLYKSLVREAELKRLEFITVNSSPNAVSVYHRLGFGFIDIEQLTDGIRYTPMKAFLHRKTLGEMTDNERSALFPVILAPYNSKWKEAYEEEKLSIQKMPCSMGITGIHHYGSTAVPGIYAKPCIDILLEISKNADLSDLIGTFQDAGYTYINYEADLPPHIMFMKGYTDIGFVGRTVHIHVRYPGEHEELIFRDYLIGHPNKAKEYEALKLRLKQQYEVNRDGYTIAKGEFIKNVIELAKI